MTIDKNSVIQNVYSWADELYYPQEYILYSKYIVRKAPSHFLLDLTSQHLNTVWRMSLNTTYFSKLIHVSKYSNMGLSMIRKVDFQFVIPPSAITSINIKSPRLFTFTVFVIIDLLECQV